jgi:hypothetical protein
LKRQKLLLLYSANSSLTSEVVAWSLYDGTGQYEFDASDSHGETRPYASVLAAMRDGWRVIQLPSLQSQGSESAWGVSYLRFETALERIEEV